MQCLSFVRVVQCLEVSGREEKCGLAFSASIVEGRTSFRMSLAPSDAVSKARLSKNSLSHQECNWSIDLSIGHVVSYIA